MHVKDFGNHFNKIKTNHTELLTEWQNNNYKQNRVQHLINALISISTGSSVKRKQKSFSRKKGFATANKSALKPSHASARLLSYTKDKTHTSPAGELKNCCTNVETGGNEEQQIFLSSLLSKCNALIQVCTYLPVQHTQIPVPHQVNRVWRAW